jgi:hypothetical protein
MGDEDTVSPIDGKMQLRFMRHNPQFVQDNDQAITHVVSLWP